MNDRITDLTKVEDKETGTIRYSAMIDQSKLVQYETDGVTKRHLKEWMWLEYVKSIMNRE